MVYNILGSMIKEIKEVDPRRDDEFWVDKLVGRKTIRTTSQGLEQSSRFFVIRALVIIDVGIIIILKILIEDLFF